MSHEVQKVYLSHVPVQGLLMLEAGAGHVVLLTNRVSASSPLQPNTPQCAAHCFNTGLARLL